MALKARFWPRGGGRSRTELKTLTLRDRCRRGGRGECGRLLHRVARHWMESSGHRVGAWGDGEALMFVTLLNEGGVRDISPGVEEKGKGMKLSG